MVMDIKRFFTSPLNPFSGLYAREHTVIGRQRLTLLVYCYLPVMMLGVLANFFNFTQPSAKFFYYTHTLFLLAASVAMYLFYKQKINVAACLSCFTIIGQAIISIEMIYCSLQHSSYYSMLVMANMVFLALNTMVSVAAYMERNTVVLGIATICVYVACSYLADDPLLKCFIIVFLIAFTFVSLVGFWVAKSNNMMEEENERLKKNEMEILGILHVKKDEVKAYLSLTSERCTNERTKDLLWTLSKSSRHNLLMNIDEYIKSRNTDLERISEVFPEFTPSEREICRLILQGKKLGDICVALDKNESNVNSQRANMRKKLGLAPADNLQKQLQLRLAQHAGNNEPEW